MTLTRRLSLTLLVVAPLIAAQDQPEVSSEERDPAQRTMEDIRDMFGLGDWGWGWRPADGQEEEGEEPSWGRGRRSVDTPGEDMETAEQLVEERERRRRLKQQENLRRHYQEVVLRPEVPQQLNRVPQQLHQIPQQLHQVPHQLHQVSQQRPPSPVVLQHWYTQGDRPIKTTAIGAVVFRPQRTSSYHPHTYYYSLH